MASNLYTRNETNTGNSRELIEYIRLETVYKERKRMFHQMNCIADVLESETEISSTARNLVHEMKQTVQDLYLIASDTYFENCKSNHVN